MTNVEFKKKILSNGVNLLGIFFGYDLVMTKDLEMYVRMRKKPKLPHIKKGEVVIIEAFDLTPHFDGISKEAGLTTLAIYDLQEGEDKDLKLMELEKQHQHQIMMQNWRLLVEFVKSITPAKQEQFYHSLEIKNAEQLVNGTDTIPIY
jgi:hypothetical protein